MPMSAEFKARLDPILPKICGHFGTPFHIYDEIGIRDTGEKLLSAFAGVHRFQEFFAVKALPNPRILKIMHDLGFGFDCSSVPELILSRQAGGTPDRIMFTSNNTSADEFTVAFSKGGCIINLDDISLLDRLPDIPETLSFRYNPGERRAGNNIIGNPMEAKFGISHEQRFAAYKTAREKGVKHFGLHAMIVSNERDYCSMVHTTTMLLEIVAELKAGLGIQMAFINIGGGLGIPYQPEQEALNIEALGDAVSKLLDEFQEKYGYAPALYLESGRYMTGSHGVLITKVLTRKETYRTYVGVDASMSSLMRPAMYDAYHHIDVYGKDDADFFEKVDVVGSLCENNDKFAVQRLLPRLDVGDTLIIHDTGAHGHAMGFNYNGRLRPKELLLCADGSVELIRREETLVDYFATLDFVPKSL
ncbi:MAG: diaminopimelate decarboxylase [Aggregatilineales bacterium]